MDKHELDGKEVNVKTAELRNRIADLLTHSIAEQETAIRNIAFYGADMGGNSFAWQMVSFVLYQAVIEILQNKIQITYPKDKFGTECFVWGVEKGDSKAWQSQFGFGISNVVNDSGDYVQFMDFPINGEMVHHYCFNRQNVANVFLDIAKRNTAHFSENDLAVAADMVRKGYVVSGENGLLVNAPVFTEEQHQMLKEMFSETAERIAGEAEALMETVIKILKNHIPSHLKRLAKDMAYLRLFEDAISAPVSILCDRKFLLPYHGEGVLPTTYVILQSYWLSAAVNFSISNVLCSTEALLGKSRIGEVPRKATGREGITITNRESVLAICKNKKKGCSTALGVTPFSSDEMLPYQAVPKAADLFFRSGSAAHVTKTCRRPSRGRRAPPTKA